MLVVVVLVVIVIVVLVVVVVAIVIAIVVQVLLKSISIHFAPERIMITIDLPGRFFKILGLQRLP